MIAEYLDFQTIWEQRILEVIAEGILPQPELAEGSRRAEFADGSVLSVTVNMGEEDPPQSGWYECEVELDYRFASTDDGETVSSVWNQIEETIGDGYGGGSPLRDRLASGDLRIPGGSDAIQYNFGTETEEGKKTFTFTAILGIQA